MSKKTNKVVKEKVVTEKKIKEKTAVLGKRKRQERPQKAISESDQSEHDEDWKQDNVTKIAEEDDEIKRLER